MSNFYIEVYEDNELIKIIDFHLPSNPYSYSYSKKKILNKIKNTKANYNFYLDVCSIAEIFFTPPNLLKNSEYILATESFTEGSFTTVLDDDKFDSKKLLIVMVTLERWSIDGFIWKVFYGEDAKVFGKKLEELMCKYDTDLETEKTNLQLFEEDYIKTGKYQELLKQYNIKEINLNKININKKPNKEKTQNLSLHHPQDTFF
ncbi:hypothetical protein DEFDS_P078 (plasmid) [Deferribacter desulfuricans SSM1]|uniref:Uncharacterized protein n=1 Tax=Deferribacter desulfuricans (strain DSM 14783 / JCM 11476 / NBRC 101012 / SSM1) TaxID=639282 RepID=D3PER0_DEFDS|nr:hypothetical protein [Deferribacter desulfuricans]BAI81702.1 hypothetical protein DEFDS_P078 [Deferribacter desulfuricans SSM1]